MFGSLIVGLKMFGFGTLKSGQISRASLSLLHTLWCVFDTLDLFV